LDIILKSIIFILWKTLITICSIVALAKVMGYAVITSAIAAALVGLMGPIYPLVAPLIGALGTLITGSDTSANVLFGNLHLSSAKALGVDGNGVGGSNMVGGAAGEMISPESVAVASAASGQDGSESIILKQVAKWCLLYLGIICIFLYGIGFAVGFL